MLVASFAGSTAKGLVFWVFGPVVLGEGCLGDVDIDEDLVLVVNSKVSSTEVFSGDDDGSDDNKRGFGSKCSGGVGGTTVQGMYLKMLFLCLGLCCKCCEVVLGI